MKIGLKVDWKARLGVVTSESIHVLGDSEEALELIRVVAVELGATGYEFDLQNMVDLDDLFDTLSLAIPLEHPTRSPNAMIDLLSDMDGLENPAGYILTLRHADDFRRRRLEDFELFMRMLVYVSDRWQTGETPFHVVLTGDNETREAIAEIVKWKSDLLMEAGRRTPGIRAHPVIVVDYGESQ